MSQESSNATATTTTTSFIISSDESLNKSTLSSSQSSESSNYTKSSDSIKNNQQYLVSLNNVNGYSNNMVLSQQNDLHLSPSSLLPLQPPSYQQSQGQVYAPLPGYHTGNIQQISHNQPYSNQNSHEAIGNTSELYGTYDQNNLQSSKLTTDTRRNIVANTTTQRFQQQPLVTTGFLTNDRKQTIQEHSTIYQTTNNINCSPNSTATTNTFYSSKKTTPKKHTSPSGLNSTTSSSLMPINVKGMLLHGVDNNEVIRAWLISIKCEEYLRNFIENGYDMPLLTRMTPQDLTAIGCKSPAVRKKILAEIRKLNLEDDIPNFRPHSLEQWFDLLKLKEYYKRICDEGYNTIEKVCELTWEDLEEIGISKLGHQKRLLLGTERVKKLDKLEEERLNDHAIYDVHPNHRVSLNPNAPDRMSTLGRSVRPGFFQTRSGANLDHRGLPIATVTPALKHVTKTLASLDINHTAKTNDNANGGIQIINSLGNTKAPVCDINNQSIYSSDNSEQVLKMSDFSTTVKRNPPPLPPTRTNSLKFPYDLNSQYNSSVIYGQNCKTMSHSGNPSSMTICSTSFLRTPKLGQLTSTTNKMLTSGGHIQSINGHTNTIRTITPMREAPPLPPIPAAPQTIPENNEEELSSRVSFPSNGSSLDSSVLINSSLISHQLASADEFPKTPPPTID